MTGQSLGVALSPGQVVLGRVSHSTLRLGNSSSACKSWRPHPQAPHLVNCSLVRWSDQPHTLCLGLWELCFPLECMIWNEISKGGCMWEVFIWPTYFSRCYLSLMVCIQRSFWKDLSFTLTFSVLLLSFLSRCTSLVFAFLIQQWAVSSSHLHINLWSYISCSSQLWDLVMGSNRLYVTRMLLWFGVFSWL